MKKKDDELTLTPDEQEARELVTGLAHAINTTGGTFTIVSAERARDGAIVQLLCIVEPTGPGLGPGTIKGKQVPIAVLLPNPDATKAQYQPISWHTTLTVAPVKAMN